MKFHRRFCEEPQLLLDTKFLTTISTFFFPLWRCCPTLAMASSFLRFLDNTQRRITVRKTPLDKWSTRRRDVYLTTHNTHKRQTSMRRRWTHNLGRQAVADPHLKPRGHWDRQKKCKSRMRIYECYQTTSMMGKLQNVKCKRKIRRRSEYICTSDWRQNKNNPQPASIGSSDWTMIRKSLQRHNVVILNRVTRKRDVVQSW
jgi:hypothetical protein